MTLWQPVNWTLIIVWGVAETARSGAEYCFAGRIELTREARSSRSADDEDYSDQRAGDARVLHKAEALA